LGGHTKIQSPAWTLGGLHLLAKIPVRNQLNSVLMLISFKRRGKSGSIGPKINPDFLTPGDRADDQERFFPGHNLLRQGRVGRFVG
jgi:hypothetical protein